MTHKITLTATSIVLSTLLLTGCGGGSSNSDSTDETTKVTGQFIDTYVEGLNYTCSSGTEGVTNSEGEYTCNAGDTVEFSLGEYVLGSATASSGIVTPATLYPEDEDAALNVAQLLQTLDTDSDDGIISIPEDFSDLDEVTVTPEDDAFDETMEEELDKPLVSETDAQEHMDDALSSNLTALLSGKTLYTTIYTRMGTLESWTFNESVTTSVWTELVGGSETGTGSVTIDDMTITFSEEDENSIVVVTEIQEDYMLIRVNAAELQRLYFDEAKARAYFLSSGSIIPIKTISSSADWDNVAVIHTDSSDGIAMSGLDIKQIKMAEDANNLYLQFERAGLDFPSSAEYYYNYWVYFKAGDATFSIENFHDDEGNVYYRVYKGIGYDGGGQVYETVSSVNVSSVNLEMVVPKSLNVIDPTATYHVTVFTHGFLKENPSSSSDILGESEDDAFEVKFNTDISTPDNPDTDLITLLSGKTLYTTIYDRIKSLESWEFSSDMTTSTWIEMVDGGCSGNGNINVDGMTLTVTATSDSCDASEIGEVDTITVTDVKADYILVSVGDTAPQRLYFDEEKARDFFLVDAVKNYFTGQTRYFANENGGTGVRTYNTDGTYSGTVGGSEVGGTYSIDGDSMTLLNTIGDRNLVFTHMGYDYDGEKFSLNISNADGTTGSVITYQYRSASDRDAASEQIQ